jgi:small GTP-binding protein
MQVGAICKVITVLRTGHTFKIVFVGDAATGKTSLIAKHIDSAFKENYIPTVCANISSKNYRLDGSSVTLMMWDIAGQEGFKKVRTQYYGGATAAFIVYDVTRPKTLQNVRAWLEDIRRFVSSAFQLTLVGNKVDLPREVNREDGEKLAKEIGAEYIETSAKTGENVETAFANMAKKLLAQVLPAPPKKEE